MNDEHANAFAPNRNMSGLNVNRMICMVAEFFGCIHDLKQKFSDMKSEKKPPNMYHCRICIIGYKLFDCSNAIKEKW